MEIGQGHHLLGDRSSRDCLLGLSARPDRRDLRRRHVAMDILFILGAAFLLWQGVETVLELR